MRNVIKAALIAVALALAAPVAAQDFDTGLEAYERGDYAAAQREWLPLAEQGNAEAQTYLGVMHRDGQGVAQDYAEALRWYRMAADQGHAAAQYNAYEISAAPRPPQNIFGNFFLRDSALSYWSVSIIARGIGCHAVIPICPRRPQHAGDDQCVSIICHAGKSPIR